MKLRQHIVIGKHIIDWVNNGNDIKSLKFNTPIMERAYLLGCIAPDMNCIYPAHRITTTEKRYINHLIMSTLLDSGLARAFILGLITHYTCDYFCYAHNNCSTGYFHKLYEKHLIKEDIPNVDKWSDGLNKFNSRPVSSEIGGGIKLITNAFEIHSMIFELNNEYKNLAPIDKHKGWYNDTEQCKVDVKFAIKAVKRVMFMLECAEVRIVAPVLNQELQGHEV